MTLTKAIGLSIFRSALTFLGAFIIGKNLPVLGALTSDTWAIIGGAALTAVGTIWGFFDKTTGADQLNSAVRSVVISIGGLFVAAGKLSQSTLDSFLGLLTAILPVISSQLQKVTNVQVADPAKPATIDPKNGNVVSTAAKQ